MTVVNIIPVRRGREHDVGLCPVCRGWGELAAAGPDLDVSTVCSACEGTGRPSRRPGD